MSFQYWDAPHTITPRTGMFSQYCNVLPAITGKEAQMQGPWLQGAGALLVWVPCPNRTVPLVQVA